MTAVPPPEWTADWQAILGPLLRPGETLLWQGAPQPGFHQPGKRLLLMVFGLPFLLGGLALFGTALLQPVVPGTSEWGFSLFLAAFALVFAGIGAFLTLGPVIEARHNATRLRYALTTRAAYILTRLVTDRVQVFPILTSTPIDIDLGQKVGTVWFHARQQRDSEGDTYVERAGFQNIADASHVFHLLRSLQENPQ
jgi:hypothetical protein